MSCADIASFHGLHKKRTYVVEQTDTPTLLSKIVHTHRDFETLNTTDAIWLICSNTKVDL
jgi:hypothetical protein